MVALDESGLAQDMPRRKGYWKKEQVVRGLGLACWGQVNAMGTLMGTVLLTVALFDTRLNWDVFYT